MERLIDLTNNYITVKIEMPTHIIFDFYRYFSDVLIGFHYIHLLIGMLLSHAIIKFFIFPYYLSIGTAIIAAVNLIALLAVNDPPYYRLKNDKDINVLDFILTIHDTKSSKICNRVYSVRATACEQWRGYDESKRCSHSTHPTNATLTKTKSLSITPENSY